MSRSICSTYWREFRKDEGMGKVTIDGVEYEVSPVVSADRKGDARVGA